MKVKTLNKKLKLNKKTISNLKDEQMNKAVGGYKTDLTQCGSVRPGCTLKLWCIL
jgi:natural product precursor